MAISENILLKKLSGHIAKQLVIKQRGGKTIVTKYPYMSRRKLSPKQLRVNETMEEDNYYARGIILNDDLRNEAQIRLNLTRNKLYTALVKEFFAKANLKEEFAACDKKAKSKK